LLNDLFKSTARKGREYSHWMDLTLTSHLDVANSEKYISKGLGFSCVRHHVHVRTKSQGVAVGLQLCGPTAKRWLPSQGPTGVGGHICGEVHCGGPATAPQDFLLSEAILPR